MARLNAGEHNGAGQRQDLSWAHKQFWEPWLSCVHSCDCSNSPQAGTCGSGGWWQVAGQWRVSAQLVGLAMSMCMIARVCHGVLGWCLALIQPEAWAGCRRGSQVSVGSDCRRQWGEAQAVKAGEICWGFAATVLAIVSFLSGKSRCVC